MARYWYWYSLSPAIIVFGALSLLAVPPLALIALGLVVILALRMIVRLTVSAARALDRAIPRTVAPVHAYALEQKQHASARPVVHISCEE